MTSNHTLCPRNCDRKGLRVPRYRTDFCRTPIFLMSFLLFQPLFGLSAYENQGVKLTGQAIASDYDQDWDDEEQLEESAGRTFLYRELVLSGFYSPAGIPGIPPGDPSQDNFDLSPRPPGNYLGFDFVWTPGLTSASKTKWIQLRAINLHPRLLFSRMEQRGGFARLKFAPQDLWVKFNLAGNDRLTLRLGQFALPYGVNPILAPRQRFLLPLEAIDLGLKWDWGMQIKGPAGSFDWELASTLGSGEVLRSPNLFGRADSTRFLFTARIGTPTYWKLQYGVSALFGYLPTIRGAQIFNRNASQGPTSLSRWRVSGDILFRRDTYLMGGAQFTFGQDGFRGDRNLVDISRGRVANLLAYRLWLDWVVPKHLDLRLAAQLENVTRDRFTPNTSETALTLEAAYSVSTSISAMMDYRIEMRKPRGSRASATFITLIYYGN